MVKLIDECSNSLIHYKVLHSAPCALLHLYLQHYKGSKTYHFIKDKTKIQEEKWITLDHTASKHEAQVQSAPWQMLKKALRREFAMDIHRLLYLTWITNKDLLYSTWNLAQCYVTT